MTRTEHLRGLLESPDRSPNVNRDQVARELDAIAVADQTSRWGPSDQDGGDDAQQR